MEATKSVASTPRPADVPPSAASTGMAPERTAQLVEFARTCKAAARAVGLYPPAHPAIAVSLDRLVETVRVATGRGSLTLTVLPQNLKVEGSAPARPEPAITELATLLHAHQIGSLTIAGDTDAESWRAFLLLLARAPDDLQQQGGIRRVWTSRGPRPIEVREIDYAEVLRERSARPATWDEIVAHYLQGDAAELHAEARETLLAIAGDDQRLSELAALVEERAGQSRDVRVGVSALRGMLGSVVDLVARLQPERLGAVLDNVGGVVGRLSIDTVAEMLRPGTAGQASGEVDLRAEISRRLGDEQIASLVARSVVEERGASLRLAEAFQALVPDDDHRHRVLQIAREEVEQSPLAEQAGLESLWGSVVEMVTSYSDASFVGREYARELSGARTQALEVEQVTDDPPERISAWLATVSDGAVRGLDVELLLDLLHMERDPAKWRALTGSVIAHVEDLLLVGDFEGAARLVQALDDQAGDASAPERHTATAEALERLVNGPMMRHIASHLRSADDHAVSEIQTLCHALGERVVQPLADALSVEELERPRQRLTELLISFGARGRRAVERLKSSANATVRRTAIYLLREFGGSEGLADLESLLGDAEPNVQREATRALVAVGTDEAHAILQKALESGTARSREVLMQALTSTRDERASYFFVYVVTHLNHRGSLRDVYMKAIEALGTPGNEQGVDVLRAVLFRGEWYAPFRTAAFREIAASALARIASTTALDALENGTREGSRGTRKAARAALASARRPPGGRHTARA